MARFVVPDRFQLLAKIASSDAEVVLRARDRLLQREVFLLCPGPRLADVFRDRDVRATMLGEARALARVRHPYVVRLLDVLETAQGPVLVIEPVLGETLADRLAREGRLEPEEVVGLAGKLAEALEAVHTAGVVHRGISSSCIVLGSDGNPCLTGFQYSKLGAATSTAMTSILYRDVKTGIDGAELSAAPSCPAPEQLLGQPADTRSDLFSLGCVLFECLAGEPPFDHANPFARKAPPDPAKLVPHSPRGLTRAIARCLEHDPGRRLESAAALRKSLPLAGRGVRRLTGARGTTTPPRRLVWAVAALVVGLAVILGRTVLTDGDASDRGFTPKTTAGRGKSELSTTYDKSYAFLIGIGQAYEGSGFQPLPNAERDVAALVAALGGMRHQWRIETLLGEAATRERVIDSLGQLADRTRENDRVFVYFAGHGIPHERSQDSGWMIPVDATRDRRSSWVRFDEFFRFFEEAKAKHILVAMDCCYGGRLTAMRSVRAQAYAERFVSRKAHVVIASGRLDEQVSDGIPGEHSPFARVMIELLNSSGPPLTSSMMFARMQEAFTNWEVPHTPQFGYPSEARGGGEFVFFREE